MKKAVLVRVGIDSTSGGCNAPVNINTGDPVYDFVYVPIPENRQVCPEYRRTYDEFNKYCDCEEFGKRLPDKLKGKNVHLDPDFCELTYGDVDGYDLSSRKINRRGKPIRELNDGDILVFYAGLEPVKSEPEEDRLIYAIIGLYVVDGKPISAKDLVNKGERGKNAHTRGEYDEQADIIVFGQREGDKSGRLTKCIPIGKRRGKGKQYRLTEELRDRWGGLWVKDRWGNSSEVNDAWIQRSVRLPYIGNPAAFYEWFLEGLDKWHIRLVPRNNLD